METIFNRNDFTENDLLFFVDRYLNDYQNYEFSKEYLAGFIDGDGSISCADLYPNYIKIEISQCDFLPIFLIQKKFGGNIQITEAKNEESRKQYKLSYLNNNAITLIEFIKDSLFLKNKQAILSLDNIATFRNRSNKEILNNNSKEIKELNSTHTSRIISGEMNWEYIAGLFDAEGCITIKKMCLSITQKNSNSLLNKICEFIGCGKVSNDRFLIYSRKGILYFLNNTNRYLIVKKQSPYVFNYLIGNEKYEKTLDIYRRKIKYEFNIPQEFIFSLFIPKSEKRTYKENTELIKELSMKKTGNNNFNFGKELSEEHCKKISDSTFGKHRSISDDKIREILKEKTSELTQKEIADKHSLSRSTVQTILSGRLIPTDEIEKRSEYIVKQQLKSDRIKKLIELGYSEKESFTISGAITKREIEGKYMVNIWYFGKLRVSKVKSLIELPFTNTSPNLSIYVSKKLGIKVSENMIKNIWNKKTQLYIIDFEEEFPVSFQNYVDDTIQENPIYFNLFEN